MIFVVFMFETCYPCKNMFFAYRNQHKKSSYAVSFFLLRVSRVNCAGVRSGVKGSPGLGIQTRLEGRGVGMESMNERHLQSFGLLDFWTDWLFGFLDYWIFGFYVFWNFGLLERMLLN